MALPLSQDIPRHILFDGDDVRVVIQPVVSKWMVVTFNWGKYEATGDRFYADALMAKLGVSSLGIVSKRPHWYVCAEMPQALEVAREALAGYAVRLGYGFSMGAYAALKYSKALGLQRVLAFSPQWSVDPREAPWDGRTEWAFSPAMKGMGVREPDRAGLAFLFFDPLNPVDRRHAWQVQRAGKVHSVRMRHCGHDTIKMMANTNAMRALVHAAVDADPARVRAAVRRRLRQSLRFRAHVLGGRGLRRLQAADVEAAQRWLKLAQAADPEALPVTQLMQQLKAFESGESKASVR